MRSEGVSEQRRLACGISSRPPLPSDHPVVPSSRPSHGRAPHPLPPELPAPPRARGRRPLCVAGGARARAPTARHDVVRTRSDSRSRKASTTILDAGGSAGSIMPGTALRWPWKPLPLRLRKSPMVTWKSLRSARRSRPQPALLGALQPGFLFQRAQAAPARIDRLPRPPFMSYSSQSVNFPAPLRAVLASIHVYAEPNLGPNNGP